MYKANKIVSLFLALMLAWVALPTASAQGVNKGARRNEAFDPVEFLSRFKVGMSYSEVQTALPKTVEQDILSYIVTDDVFLLTVDMPTSSNWSASFKFDTLDTPLRKPERLVELSCSATLSSRSESFESIVRKVTEAFGQPIKVDRTEDKFQQAGWRVSGGSLLTLEYSFVPAGFAGSDVNVDFIIRKNKRRDSPTAKDIA